MMTKMTIKISIVLIAVLCATGYGAQNKANLTWIDPKVAAA